MDVFNGLRQVPLHFGPSVVTIGNFDGLHLGHQCLVKETIRQGQLLSAKPVVFTFSPHPVKVLFPQRPFYSLFSKETLKEELGKMEVGALILEPFTKEFSQIRAQDFIKSLKEKLHPKAIVVGPNFRWGFRHEGDIKLLKELGEKMGFQTIVVDPVLKEGRVVSSSWIRELLLKGDVKKAHELLGRPFFLKEEVKKGQGRGQQISIPTANFVLTDPYPLMDGVYITRTWRKNKAYPSVTNVGGSPTFGTQGRLVETHLIDEKAMNLYGEVLKVEFLDYLRKRKKFSSLEELKAQIGRDIDRARDFFKS
ncbi:MAG: bifunctional riboflavin kinase/FAD synthetase [Bdellovibrio sp.]|nr:MAG: bifunctional riboflavin kinase/FAD synthetase [Bdellovibrio sp.]